jgi:replication-associated recombination protein RarA
VNNQTKQQPLIKEIAKVKSEDKEYRPKTKTGHFLDEVVSALQKFIRRQMEYEAVWMAHELIESGYWKYLFRRLMVISAEDVGLADEQAAILTSTVYSSLVAESQLRGKSWFQPDQNRVDMVVMYLARAKKSRTVDYLGGIILKKREKGERVEIPDYAKDQHTKSGREKRMGDKEFFEEGSRIKNKGKVDKDEEYKKKCLKLYGFKNLKRNESMF